MVSENNWTLRKLCCAALGCLMMISAASPVMGQQLASTVTTTVANNKTDSASTSAKPAAAAISAEEMLATIRRLEERVKELETRLNQSKPISPETAAAVKSTEPAAATTAAPKQDDKQATEKQNNGILSFFRSTEITGFVDAYYAYNFNRPTSGVNQLRNFDTEHNRFSFNLAEIALEKKPTPDARLGFRMDLNFGSATEIVHSLEPAKSETYKHLQQGYLSYLAPAGNGLQIDVGKFVTPHGAEVIETKDNWNYSRGLLFAWAIPYYHFGVRATYPVNDKFSVAGFLVNGWNNVLDNNTGKTVGGQFTIKPNSKFTLIQNYMAGPEANNNNDDWRHLTDTTIIVSPNSKLSLMANYDYAWDRAGGAHWQGIAAYARIQANDWLAFTPRFEWFDDHDGFSTGKAQTLKEFTFTSEHKINKGLLTRLEYRRDNSDTPFFIKSVNRLVKAQSTLAFGLVYAFSSKSDQ